MNFGSLPKVNRTKFGGQTCRNARRMERTKRAWTTGRTQRSQVPPRFMSKAPSALNPNALSRAVCCALRLVFASGLFNRPAITFSQGPGVLVACGTSDPCFPPLFITSTDPFTLAPPFILTSFETFLSNYKYDRHALLVRADLNSRYEQELPLLPLPIVGHIISLVLAFFHPFPRRQPSCLKSFCLFRCFFVYLATEVALDKGCFALNAFYISIKPCCISLTWFFLSSEVPLTYNKRVVELETVQTHTPTPANANADRKRTRKHVLSKQSRACAFGGVKHFWTLLHSIVPNKAKKSKHQAAAVKRAEEELEHVNNPPQPSTSTVAPQQEAEPKMMAHKNSLSSTISRENPEKVKDEAVRLVRSKTEHATRMFKGEREGLHEAIMNSFSKTAIQWFVRRPNYSEEDLEKEIRDTLHTFSRFLVEWRLGHLMIPALIYTERYFTILRRINDQFIFDLFMTRYAHSPF